jgi:polysaccharide pyruvyl transferase WcaK-like protein
MAPVHVVLANVSADDNRGGCAITEATLGAIERSLPGSDISLIPAAGIADIEHALRHTQLSFPRARVLPAILPPRSGYLVRAAIRGLITAVASILRRPRGTSPLAQALTADLVVTRGDALFVDRPSIKGLLSICAASLPAVVATRWGVPSVFSGTEVGPFAHRASRAVASAILPRAGLIVVRNDDSRDHALALGVRDERVVTLPDTAFGFPRPDRSAAESLASSFGFTPSRFVFVTVGADRPLAGMSSFESRLASLLRSLLDGGLVDQVAVVVQVDGRHISDRAASARFVERAADPRFRLVDADLAPAALVGLNASAAFSIGTRMHASILSLVAGTPTFPVAVWPKVRKLFEPLGLDDWILPFPDLDPEAAARSIVGVLADRKGARERARRIADDQRDRLHEFEALLARAASRPARG